MELFPPKSSASSPLPRLPKKARVTSPSPTPSPAGQGAEEEADLTLPMVWWEQQQEQAALPTAMELQHQLMEPASAQTLPHTPLWEIPWLRKTALEERREKRERSERMLAAAALATSPPSAPRAGCGPSQLFLQSYPSSIETIENSENSETSDDGLVLA
jgi:hypothetical protein